MQQWKYLRLKIGKEILSKRKHSSVRYLPGQRHVVDAAMRAWYRYIPMRQLSGTVDVFRENIKFSDLYVRYNDQLYEWGKFVEGTIISHPIDCSQLELLNTPHVNFLAKIIEQRIRN